MTSVLVIMPLCEGPPNQPCPHKAIGFLSQGDLILCRDCEEARFPYMKTIKPGKVKEPQVKTRHSTRSRGQPNLHQSKGVASAKNGSVRNSSVASDCDSFPGLCPRCHEPSDKTCLFCDICRESYHSLCTGLSHEVYSILATIVRDVGWVCADCRIAGSSKLASLQGSLARTSEEICLLRTMVTDLKGELDGIKPIINATTLTTCIPPVSADNNTPIPTDFSNAGPFPSASVRFSEHRMEISKVLHDINRRKNNVVITGLPEPLVSNESERRAADCDAFLRLCEEHLDVKPLMSHLGCRRLGKPEDFVNRPRKLLVHLTSETSATNVIQSAKLLRRSTDPISASQVYINPDLSPSDAKLAFEKRQRKRNKRKGGSDTHVGHDDAVGDVRDVDVDVGVDDQPATISLSNGTETDNVVVHHKTTVSSTNNTVTVTVAQKGAASLSVAPSTTGASSAAAAAAASASSSSSVSPAGTLVLTDATVNTPSSASAMTVSMVPQTITSATSPATSSSSTGMPFQ